MVITFSEANITMLISFTAEETATVSWMRAHYGDYEFTMYMERLLKDRAAQMNDTVKDKVWNEIKTNQALNDEVSLATETNLSRVMVTPKEEK